MNLKPIACSVLTLSAFFLCSPLQADVYLGAGAGISSFNYDGVDDGSAKKLYLGYRFTDSNFAVEIANIDSGDASIDGLDGLNMSIEGINLSAVYNTATDFGKSEPFNIFFKGGIYNTDSELSAFGESISDSSAGLSLGLGLEYAFADFFSVRADLEGLIGVEDFADDESVTLFTVGAQFHF